MSGYPCREIVLDNFHGDIEKLPNDVTAHRASSIRGNSSTLDVMQVFL